MKAERVPKSYPNLRVFAFNGGKAQTLFRKYIAHDPHLKEFGHKSVVLPSSSPTPGRNVLSFDEKAVRWKRALNP